MRSDFTACARELDRASKALERARNHLGTDDAGVSFDNSVEQLQMRLDLLTGLVADCDEPEDQ